MAPAESNSVGPIAGAVAAAGSVTIISFSMIIIITRSHQAHLEVRKTLVFNLYQSNLTARD